jgi:3-hydroxyacyl-[acyl-carrier-protein] dehydratase
MRFFLVDKVTEISLGQSAKGIKCVTLTDPILHDHFPGLPIFPGSLITEGLAQLGGFLLEVTVNQDVNKPMKRAVIGQIEKMKFMNFSSPGDSLEYTAKITSMLETGARVEVEATCQGQKRAVGFLQFYLAEYNSPEISDQRKKLYKLWTRDLNLNMEFR